MEIIKGKKALRMGSGNGGNATGIGKVEPAGMKGCLKKRENPDEKYGMFEKKGKSRRKEAARKHKQNKKSGKMMQTGKSSM